MTRNLMLAMLMAVILQCNYCAAEIKVAENASELTVDGEMIRLTARKSGEIKFVSPDNFGSAVSLTPLSGDAAAEVNSWKWTRNTSAVIVDFYAVDGRRLLSATVNSSSAYVLLKGGEAADGACMKAKFQTSVLPDSLANDFIYQPAECGSIAQVPGDAHLLLNLFNSGASILACIWSSTDSQVSLRNGGDSFSENVIKFGKNKELCLGVLSAPGIWYTVKEKAVSGNYTKIGWKLPFNNAYWTITYKIKKGFNPVMDGTFDSFDLLEKGGRESRELRGGSGSYNPNSPNMYTGFTGKFALPFYYEQTDVYYKHPTYNAGADTIYFDNLNAVVYPAVNSSQSGKYIMPFTMARKILPEQAFKKLVPQKGECYKYPATCGVTEEVHAIYRKEEAKQKKAFIAQRVGMMDKFFTLMRVRLDEYLAWSKNESNYLDETVRQNQQLKPYADKINADLKLIETSFNASKPEFKTPEDYLALSRQLAELADKNIPDEKKEDESDKLGRAIRTMGASQDHLSVMFRVIVKSLRHRLEQMLASGNLTPEARDMVLKVRSDCGDVLRVRVGMEGK